MEYCTFLKVGCMEMSSLAVTCKLTKARYRQ